MPELPEVEAAARGLEGMVGKAIAGVERLDVPGMVETPLAAFEAALPGQRVLGVSRRAKWILVALTGDLTLAIHLRMTGDVALVGPEAEPDRHTHFILAFTDGSRLFFRDPRKFGRLRLLDAPGLAALDAAHGVEPLGPAFTARRLATLLQRRTRLKPLLLDQSVVAGIGNIYADEALWEARLHPLRPAESLSKPEVARLHEAIRTVLTRAVDSQGAGWRYYRTGFDQEGRPESYMRVYDRAGQPCPRCGTPIERLLVAGRGTHLCPRCQLA